MRSFTTPSGLNMTTWVNMTRRISPDYDRFFSHIQEILLKNKEDT
jgi:hypothetical protein